MLILFKEKKKKCEARTLTFPALRNHVRTEGSCPPTPWFTCRRPSARDAVFVPSHPCSFAPASAERGRVTSFDGPVWQAPRWLGQSRLLLSESSAVRGGCVCFSAPPGRALKFTLIPCRWIPAHVQPFLRLRQVRRTGPRLRGRVRAGVGEEGGESPSPCGHRR